VKRGALAIAGPAFLLAVVFTPPPGGMEETAWRVAGLAAWMALWWLTGFIPLEATALLPIVFLPLLGVQPVGRVTAAYADPVIFLFLGGFLLAATLERWELHRRLALAAVSLVGVEARRVVLAFLLASAAVSMWISNTATALVMLPIALAVTSGSATRSGDFSTAVMLAVAYGSSIGGVATLIGTPPNAIFAASARELLGREVSFGDWMLLGVPIALLLCSVCWVVLTWMFGVRGSVRGLEEHIRRESASLGRMQFGERFVIGVFTATALAWIFREPKILGATRIPGLSDLLPGISDPAIAIAAALVLFVVPLPRSRYRVALDWDTARSVPWGILLLFGGGLALAGAFEESGLTRWIGARLEELRGAPMPLIVLASTSLFVFLTELTSNTATTALGMPLLAGVAEGLAVPALPLMAAGALGASMAFMLPVATPPNAIVFGSGAVAPKDMARAGLVLNLASIAVITLAVTLWPG
jgi:sodium-dependent dicarboxylate transporter 2/3/5